MGLCFPFSPTCLRFLGYIGRILTFSLNASKIEVTQLEEDYQFWNKEIQKLMKKKTEPKKYHVSYVV